MNKIQESPLALAHGNVRQQVISLLKQNNLPVSDIDDSKILFALFEGPDVVGTGGLEFFNDCALLRSLSVRKDRQGKGLGKSITRQLEQLCKDKGIPAVYLLTETAEAFFNKQDYRIVDRASAPQSIKNSSEFTTVCSATGILMKKNI
jgi:amino-acid N-acetyltransferase